MHKPKSTKQAHNLVWTSTALQDHIISSSSLNLGSAQRNSHYKKRTKWAQERSSLHKPKTTRQKKSILEELLEYEEKALENDEELLSLAEKMNLVPHRCSRSKLADVEWDDVKSKAFSRDRDNLTCSICVDMFKTTEQVLLSCSHTFHKRCLASYENHVGRKSCPLCRCDSYEKRLVNYGKIQYVVYSATKIQATYRMHQQRRRYLHIRATTVPKTEYMRKKYVVDKFTQVVKSLKLDSGVDVTGGNSTDRFLREIESSIDASKRAIVASTQQLLLHPQDLSCASSATYTSIASAEWDKVVAKRRQQIHSHPRDEDDACPICLSVLSTTASNKNKGRLYEDTVRGVEDIAGQRALFRCDYSIGYVW
ncbi:hypothetical protein SeMB42_g02911 [Synchytrium endobioticum]|uniref:RING-type domain-containing protein n=1 Tax=Synchytrium endobioticum TaxID=286115 RepID=A0A507DCT0_9FUNG|nr:hypothetical protein SeMB42_g02911 [Synchytrium endobioticum]